MYLCYLDESGTSTIPGNTSHYILAGLAIPAFRWKTCDRDINQLKIKWKIENSEIHTAWILRKYLEQSKISNFENLDFQERRYQVLQFRKRELLRLQHGNPKTYMNAKKTYRRTEAYIHLTHDERKSIILEKSKIIGNWGFARLFGECIDKIYFDPEKAFLSVEEQAFEQIVSRFEHFLRITSSSQPEGVMGMLIHDNNETVAKKLNELMMKFYKRGTFWTEINCIIETPLFVDSQLTCMVQAADLCSYALRRYLENDENALIKNIFERADRKENKVVGVRHFTDNSCSCLICSSRI